MSEWVYIGAAYGLTWATLAFYAIYLGRRRARALVALRQTAQRQEGRP
jgi:hypothetical protein